MPLIHQGDRFGVQKVCHHVNVLTIFLEDRAENHLAVFFLELVGAEFLVQLN